MWDITNELEDAAKEKLEFHRPKPQVIPYKPTPRPEEEQEEDLISEINREWREEAAERRADFARKTRERNKKMNKQRTKVPKPRKQKPYSEDALARMDQRRYNAEIKRQGTLTPRQKEILTDYSNGLRFDLVAAKNKITVGAVGDHLVRIRLRLCAYTNAHAVKRALQLGLIQ